MRMETVEGTVSGLICWVVVVPAGRVSVEEAGAGVGLVKSIVAEDTAASGTVPWVMTAAAAATVSTSPSDGAGSESSISWTILKAALR